MHRRRAGARTAVQEDAPARPRDCRSAPNRSCAARRPPACRWRRARSPGRGRSEAVSLSGACDCVRPHHCHSGVLPIPASRRLPARRAGVISVVGGRRGGLVLFRALVALLVLAVLRRRLRTGSTSPRGSRPLLGARRCAAARRRARWSAPAYPDPRCRPIVDRVGQRLVAQAGVPATYRFVVLDLPVANAHALSSGYVFVTRGLLAVLDDEAELAAASATSSAISSQRHAAQRARARQGRDGGRRRGGAPPPARSRSAARWRATG